jgi:hypothetical protein
MAYHDDLLSQALHLVHTAPSTQASLRRAVSSAYYAVFHLLIAEATSNWNNVKLRAALGRAYDHGIVRTASNRLSTTRDFPFTGEDPQVVGSLRFVALTFTQLQEDRHFADYNLTGDLDPTDALNQVQSAEKVFKAWPSISSHQIVQEYLVSLVVKNR